MTCLFRSKVSSSACGRARGFKWLGLHPRRSGLRAAWQVKPASSRPHWVHRLRFVPIRTSSSGTVLPTLPLLCPFPPGRLSSWPYCPALFFAWLSSLLVGCSGGFACCLPLRPTVVVAPLVPSPVPFGGCVPFWFVLLLFGSCRLFFFLLFCGVWLSF